MNNRPLVSICCTTFNHQNYIEDTIKGFLAQETKFVYEIIIHDDASTDSTAEIIKKFAIKYPKLIFPIIQKENQWSKGIRPSTSFVWPKAKGKYIALCEGDDYWIDPFKLQKQVDILESNPNIGIVHTECDSYNDSTGRFKRELNRSANNIIPKGDIYEDLLIRNTIKTLTVLFRSSFIKRIDFKNFSNFKMGDYPLWLEISRLAKVDYIDESSSVYRIRNNSLSNHNNLIESIRFKRESYKIKYDFIKKYGCTLRTEKAIKINYNQLELDYAFNQRNSKTVKKHYRSLKELENIKIDTLIKYLGSKSKFSFFLAILLLKISHKVRFFKE